MAYYVSVYKIVMAMVVNFDQTGLHIVDPLVELGHMLSKDQRRSS